MQIFFDGNGQLVINYIEVISALVKGVKELSVEDDKLWIHYRRHFLANKEDELRHVSKVIYEKYGTQINKYIAGWVNRTALRPQLASGLLEKQDIIAEVWLEIFGQLQKYALNGRKVTSISGLSSAIAKNVVRNIARRNKRDPGNSPSIEYEEIDKHLLNTGFADLPEIPEQIVLRKDLEEFLLVLIETLPPKQGEAIKRFYFDGESLREIAEKEGKTRAAIHSRIKKGMEKMKREILGKDGE